MNSKIHLILVITLLICTFDCSQFDPEKQIKAALELEASGRYKEAIALFNKVSKKSKGTKTYYRAQAELGQCYYYINDFEKARRVCKDLLAVLPEDSDPRIGLDAEMVLLSIERKTSAEKRGVQ